MKKKSLLFLISFYGAALLGCEKPSVQSSNYAERVKAIVQKHKWKMAIVEVTLNFSASGKQVKKISVKIGDFTKIEKGLQELEQYDWATAKRTDATELMKKGMSFALTLNQLNSFFSIEEQYRQENWLVTIFNARHPYDYNYVKGVFGTLSENSKNTIEDFEFFD